MSLVYFLQIENGGPIKIGITRGEVADRVVDLQVGCPWRIDIIGSVDGTEAHEAWLHSKFSELRMNGEWFRATDDLKEYIRFALEPTFIWPLVISEISPLERAIKVAGSEAKLAAGTGYSQVAINKAKIKGRPTPEMALAIDRFLGGSVSAHEMRPDIWVTLDAADAAARRAT